MSGNSADAAQQQAAAKRRRTEEESSAGLRRGARGPRLAGRVAVVTGAGSSGPGWGTGKAIAVAMAREGARIGLVDVSSEAAEATAEIIRQEGGECRVLPRCNIAEAAEVDRMVAACEETLGAISILVNNVGLICPGDCVSVPVAKWEHINAVNVLGAFHCSQACIRRFLAAGLAGAIVNISSTSALRVIRPEIAYASSKGALNSLTIAISREFAGQQVRCNAIAPGLLETPLVRNAFAGQDIKKTMASRHALSPTGRMGDAWDVAHAAVYLASDEARYTNGIVMPVDGSLINQVLPHEAGARVPRPPARADAAAEPSMRLSGKVAFVTAAHTAIGGAVASTFRACGASVFAVGDGDGLEAYDMTSEAGAESAIRKCVQANGKIDILVNGPGVNCGKPLLDTSSADFQAIYRSNATAVLMAMRFVVPAMLEQKGGAIVNISSIAGMRYVQPDAAVAAAAGSINIQTVQTAATFADRGIRCNAIVPMLPKEADALNAYALGVADMALSLCSDEARCTTGQLIHVDLSASWRLTTQP